MLTPEDNALLMRTTAGTPMGEALRRFWIPFMLASELAQPDGPQQRVTLLGEKLIAFRDTQGRVGLVDEHCPHRRASLYFGRNEACGLRCGYHGLKFDVTGRCVEWPAAPREQRWEDKLRLKAYPVREAGGLLWAYMGPPDTQGELPAFEWMGLPDSHRHFTRWIQDANYFGALEGEIDSSHVGFAHRRIDKIGSGETSSIFGSYILGDLAPQLSIAHRPYGLESASARQLADGRVYWRISQFMLPFFTMIASSIGGPITARAWVPADDEHTIAITLTYQRERPLNEEEMRSFLTGETSHPVLIPGTLRPRANRDNDYLLDREKQRTTHFTGIETVRAQDAALTESAGALPDRSLEFLGPGDVAIVAARRRMLQMAREMAQGQPPRSLQELDSYRIRPLSVVLPAGLHYTDSPEVAQALRTA